jgi:antitoxin YefM
MGNTTSYTEARQNFAELLDRAVNDREVITITRRGSQDVALIAADELASLIETSYLLSSPKNARRLFEALEESKRGEGVEMTVDELRKQVGFTEGKAKTARKKEAAGKLQKAHGKESRSKGKTRSR